MNFYFLVLVVVVFSALFSSSLVAVPALLSLLFSPLFSVPALFLPALDAIPSLLLSTLRQKRRVEDSGFRVRIQGLGCSGFRIFTGFSNRLPHMLHFHIKDAPKAQG